MESLVQILVCGTNLILQMTQYQRNFAEIWIILKQGSVLSMNR